MTHSRLRRASPMLARLVSQNGSFRAWGGRAARSARCGAPWSQANGWPRLYASSRPAERHILVGVDGGNASMRALETAVGMAGREDHVTLFSVPPLLEADPQRAGARLADAVAEAYAGARERVRMSAYAAAKVAKCHIEWKEGDALSGPKRELLRCIDEDNVDLVVLGARNLPTLERLFGGSVSSYVAKRANCAVLVVR